MDALQRARRPVRNDANKRVTELEKLSKVEPVPKERMLLVLGVLIDAQDSLTELDQKIMDQMVNDNYSEAEQNEEYEAMQELKIKIRSIRMKTEKILEASEPVSFSPPSVVFGSEGGARIRGVRLPKIELKTFSGELKDWLGYWAQFEKIDQDASLHGSDKFQYLLQSLIPGTDAYEIASSYPQSNENYSKVVEALKKRYGNEDLLLQVYIRELLKLVISNMSSSEKIPFHMLHLKLESHLRALKTLKLEKADPATWLYPLVESSLPEDILLTWQRSPLSVHDGSKDEPPRNRLDLLMEFLEKEVEIWQKINLAREGFELEKKRQKENVQKKNKPSQHTPTLASCHIGESSTCIFCKKAHESKECSTAKHWALEKKRNVLKEKRLCFACFRPKHTVRFCKAKLDCFICGRKHYPVMCPNFENNKDISTSSENVLSTSIKQAENLSEMVNQTCSKKVALQTLLITAFNGNRRKQIRAFLDTGSQGSYILKSTAEELGLEVKAMEQITHSLFGGTQTQVVQHKKYNLTLEKSGGGYSCIIGVRDQSKICNFIPRISESYIEVMNELENKGITLSDVGEGCPPIEVLLGADVYGKLVTGHIIPLSSGVTAIETKLGWTLCGKMKEVHEDSLSLCVLSMAVNDSTISQLWDLDLIGIHDDTNVKTAKQIEEEDKQKFFEGLSRKEDGRYVVSLPWIDGHTSLPTNYEVAKKRLQTTTRKLEENGLFETYSKVFEDWKKERFIEEVPTKTAAQGVRVHYVPHRAVIKLSSTTTPVRPVFDASCKMGKAPSLNDCLKKGSNYIQLIPEILLHFRERTIGFISDIRKAFQMIEVKEDDRDSMRFLWWKDSTKQELVEYRHVRVMFGATCSPFILGAVLEYHLKNVQTPDKVIAERLLQTLYVDNCVCSTDTMTDYKEFREKSTSLLAEAGMDLRLWVSNIDEMEDSSTHTVPVLGIQWNRIQDELFVDTKNITLPQAITKKTLLSVAQKIYDPIGIVCPAVIPVKMLLQNIFINKLKWDEPLPEEEKKFFIQWISQVKELSRIKIPRCFTRGVNDRQHWSLHIFTDASSVAYGTVVFLRIELPGGVSVQLVEARARVAPIRKMTIPRLELLGCLIGARLANSVRNTLHLDEVPVLYWSDSSTALAWIKRNDQWGTYVGNRVKEIRKLTDPDQWRHVPGQMNPADLLSRGCSPSQLLEKQWWEGPDWLKKSSETWPCQCEEVSEELIQSERSKSEKVGVSIALSLFDEPRRSLTFQQSVRVVAWCRRFFQNSKNRSREGTKKLTDEELRQAETALILSIQREAFSEKKALRKLDTFIDVKGIIRVKTKITLLDTEESFRCPIVLPGKNELVKQLVRDKHRLYCHAGCGFLMSKLREKYWITQARKTITSVIINCVRCRRYAAKAFVTEVSPLPVERIQAARVFEVIGLDVAGPLYLKNKKKVWVVIFTCAVYRAVRLEVITSLSTAAFIEALKKFTRMNGRPRIIFSDNGTNFHGADNFFKTLDWDVIRKIDPIEPIQWKFNVASAPWWGGFYERLIRTMKDLLKRTIGKTTLNKHELVDVLIIVEEVMNGRPLTYVTENGGDLEPLTPSMFMNDPGGLRFPEGCESDADKIRCRWKYLVTLKKELHQRFRKEYLSQLVSRAREKPTRLPQEGELVLIGTDNKKRVMWPLGRIVELIPGKDGIVRVAKVKTESGVITRPVQRLFPLEIDLEASLYFDSHMNKTRTNRVSK